MNPYEQHRRAKDRQREAGYQRRKREKLAVADNFVPSWEARPLLCRLGIHRPVVWQERACRVRNGKGYVDTHRIMPHCGRCGAEWRGFL